ncbi:hypothetical protein YQE_02758, partial [Dendroctonus ponderosae]
GVDNSLAPFDDDWVPKNEIPPSLIAYIPGPSRSEPINMSFSQLIRKGVDETLKFKFHENQEECSTIDNIELVYEKDDNIEGSEPSAKRKLDNSRRRPVVIKTLTTSSLAEKYEQLVDKKLELLKGLQEEHFERMEILKL